MKKYLIYALTIAILLSFSACRAQEKQDVTLPYQPTPSQPEAQESTCPTTNLIPEQKPMYAVSFIPQAEETLDKNGKIRFKYTNQNIALVLPEPEVADRIILDYLRRMDRADQYAQTLSIESLRDEYKDSSVPFVYNVMYTPKRFDSILLSMIETDIEYMGWFHPNDYSHGVTYDLLTGEVLKLSDVLNSNITAENVAAIAISKVTNTEDLWPNYKEIIQESFVVGLEKYDCWYLSENGLVFYFDPYLLAPYAAGPVTIEIPYKDLLGTLRDEYFPAEKDTYIGNLIVEPFATDSFNNYTQFSEVVLVEGGLKILLSAENIITNISIQAVDKVNLTGPTVMAVQSLTPGDAIMVEYDSSTTNLLISYRTGDKYETKTLTYNEGQMTLS